MRTATLKTLEFLGFVEPTINDEEVNNMSPYATPAQKFTSRFHPKQSNTPYIQDEIRTFNPRTFHEAQQIAEAFRENITIIMNISNMRSDEAKRLIDFTSGLVIGLEGHIEKISSKVFLLTPAHVVSNNEGTKNFTDEITPLAETNF